MDRTGTPHRIAVIGTGLAGTAAACGLREAGHEVWLFDKARGVGGRCATRRAAIVREGRTEAVEFDHGLPAIPGRHARLRRRLERAAAVGLVERWVPRVHGAPPSLRPGAGWVPLAGMPALMRAWLQGLPLRLEAAVQRLQRGDDGRWALVIDGRAEGGFDQVVLALPPGQAAALLAGHHDLWADRLAGWPMAPAWTLMAVTDEVDWPWDACEPDTGPLAWVARNDRRPGRTGPAGCAVWVAHADPAWSRRHLEADPADVAERLGHALQGLLPPAPALRWHHRAVHRWRYAAPMGPAPDERLAWWDEGRGLAVCGDFLGGGDADGAWRSGDELADRIAAELEAVSDGSAVSR
jgi:predicted NAD/FAD-dependent oxidoreductase